VHPGHEFLVPARNALDVDLILGGVTETLACDGCAVWLLSGERAFVLEPAALIPEDRLRLLKQFDFLFSLAPVGCSRGVVHPPRPDVQLLTQRVFDLLERCVARQSEERVIVLTHRRDPRVGS
jgi:hypothetical protein